MHRLSILLKKGALRARMRPILLKARCARTLFAKDALRALMHPFSAKGALRGRSHPSFPKGALRALMQPILRKARCARSCIHFLRKARCARSCIHFCERRAAARTHFAKGALGTCARSCVHFAKGALRAHCAESHPFLIEVIVLNTTRLSAQKNRAAALEHP